MLSTEKKKTSTKAATAKTTRKATSGKTKTKTKTKATKATKAKTPKTSASNLKSKIDGFLVKYDGLNSKIFKKPVNPAKLPRNTFATVEQAKKEITNRVKADTKAFIDKISSLKSPRPLPKQTRAKTKATTK